MNVYTKESQWVTPDKPAKPSSDSAEDSSDSTVRCSHLLVKHAGSRRPSSWREETITRTQEEAMDIIKCDFSKNL